MALATRLAAGPTYALGLARRLAWFALEEKLVEQLALERRLQRLAGRNPDFEEGMAAFRDKRAPQFSGASTSTDDGLPSATGRE
jgi:2-(1,2-epoxy-1,2-dihydrophenyl)acetyl-CoA isomerase